jgi:hypothetical protein
MSFPEKAVSGVWGANIVAICAANPNEVRHCLSVLALYSATYFLFAPLHALILLCAWTAYGAERQESPKAESCALRAVVRVLCAETVVFWGLYWGMVLEVVPLHMRV